MRLRATILLSLAGLTLGLPASAAKSAGRVSLRVERDASAEQCVAGAALERAVEARLGRAVFTDEAQAPLLIRLTLARHGQGQWAANLALEASDGRPLGERQITSRGAHCSVLDESLALVVALLVDAPLAAQVEKEARAAQSPSSATGAMLQSPPAAKAATILVPADTHAPRAPWRVELAAEALASFALLPSGALGFELGLGAKPPQAPALRWFAGVYQPRRVEVSPSSGARFTLSYLGLEVCPIEAHFGSLRGAACLGQTVGTLHASATGFDENSSTRRLYFALVTRVELVLPLSERLGVRVDARAEAPLSRTEFVYAAAEGGERRLFQGGAVAAVLGAGLTVRLR